MTSEVILVEGEACAGEAARASCRSLQWIWGLKRWTRAHSFCTACVDRSRWKSGRAQKKAKSIWKKQRPWLKGQLAVAPMAPMKWSWILQSMGAHRIRQSKKQSPADRTVAAAFFIGNRFHVFSDSDLDSGGGLQLPRRSFWKTNPRGTMTNPWIQQPHNLLVRPPNAVALFRNEKRSEYAPQFPDLKALRYLWKFEFPIFNFCSILQHLIIL